MISPFFVTREEQKNYLINDSIQSPEIKRLLLEANNYPTLKDAKRELKEKTAEAVYRSLAENYNRLALAMSNIATRKEKAVKSKKENKKLLKPLTKLDADPVEPDRETKIPYQVAMFIKEKQSWKDRGVQHTREREEERVITHLFVAMEKVI